MYQPKLLVRKSDIEHKVRMGVLFDIYYDTETSDLNKRFANITQFGGAITDLAGNILHTVDLRAKVSPYTVFSPYAWIVQRMRLHDLNRGDERPIFMGKVLRFFQHINKLDQSPFIDDFLKGCTKGFFKNDAGRTEEYYSYPVLNDDGTIDNDFIRIHSNLKKFYFKDPLNGQWVRRDIKSFTIGYNNVNADDQWLWTAAHMAGFENIFITHLSKFGKYRLDALRVVEAVVVAGKSGANSLRALRKKDPRTGEDILSFSQGSIIKANTSIGSEIRNVADGITLNDGSQIDLSQLHGALADSISLVGLMRYIRNHHPNVLRQMEENSDWEKVIHNLTDVKSSFGNNPPLAYVDKSFPNIDGKMVSLIGTDQFRNAPKIAVVWNLGIDPQTYTYNGKKISELNRSDWKQILADSKGNPNSPLKVIRAHKSPRLLDAATGYAAGFNLGLDRGQIQRRINDVRKSNISDEVMAGLRLAFPRLHGSDRLVLPQIEEELFALSTLILFDDDLGEEVQVHYRLQNKVEEIAQKSRSHIMKVRALWMRAIQFDEDIFVSEDGAASQMIQKIKDINRDLSKHGAVQIPLADSAVIDRESALQYKIKILFYARNYFAQGVLQDIGHHFWFENEQGIRYSDRQVKDWPQHRLDEALKSGQLKIKHEQVTTITLIIDRIIEELGYAEILGPMICKQLAAYKSLRYSGIPHYYGVNDRWYTVAQAKRDIAKIERNEITDVDIVALEGYIPGAWEKFIGDHHDNFSSLSEYKEYIDSIGDTEISSDHLPLLGIDPETKLPFSNPDYQIDLHNANILQVPERCVDNIILDPVTQLPVIVLPIQETFNNNSSGKINNLQCVLKTDGTGKLYHFANARVVDLPSSGLYQDFYQAVRNVYHQSGVEYPARVFALVGNGPYPIHNVRRGNAKAQSIMAPSHMFEGMLSPKLSGFAVAPHGVILRDDALRIERGPIRIQEMDDGELTGWEFEADVVSVRDITINEVLGFNQCDLDCLGFPTNDEAVDRFSSLFSRQLKDPRDPRNKAKMIVFSNINPHDPNRGMMFYKPDERVISSTLLNDQNGVRPQ